MATTLHKPPSITYPVSLQTNWVTDTTNPKSADNSGNRVLAPAALSSSRRLDVREATTLLFRHKYVTATPPTTSSTLQPFGFDANGIPMELYDKDDQHEIALTVTASSDMAVGSNSFTPWKAVDVCGCAEAILAVKTASSGGTGIEELQVKLL